MHKITSGDTMEFINKLLWAVAISMIFFNSIYYSFKLKFPQLKWRKIINKISEKESKDTITAKDTLMMSLASKIGAGSLAGIAYAIFYGGPGTVFWIWVSSFLVSINCFIENVLSTLYKQKDHKNYKGGPAYYIKNGLNKKMLSYIYAIIAILAYTIGFLSIQNNTITTLVTQIYDVPKIYIALIVTIVSALVIVKGLTGISKVCNKLVPIMSILYFILGFIVLFLHIEELPSVIALIIKEAFSKSAISGGIVYTFIIGIQKGIFSNEAGVGTSAIISGSTSNKDPIKQGYIGIIETFFISLFITTITAFIILFSNYNILSLQNINGVEITKYAFFNHFGHFGEIILLIILILFAFSTIITVYYYGESNIKFLTNKRFPILILKIIAFFSLLIGGIVSSSSSWQIVDLFVALLAIINIYTIFKLRDKVISFINKNK